MLHGSFTGRLRIIIWPVIATAIIVSDWRSRTRMRECGHKSVLDALRDDQQQRVNGFESLCLNLCGIKAASFFDMGTFTFSYCFKKMIWERKTLWLSVATAAYLGYCMDRQGMHKASMMKGKSKMFADRNAQIPKDQDIWKY